MQCEKELESSGGVSEKAVFCWELFHTPGQQAGVFWRDTWQPKVPFAQRCFATSSKDEWSEDESGVFLWEASHEGMKAVGRGKLTPGEQPALEYLHCFLYLLPWVFIFLWYAVKFCSHSQEADLDC